MLMSEGVLRSTQGPLMPSEVLLGLAWAPSDQQGALSDCQGPSGADRRHFRPSEIPRTDGCPLKTTEGSLRPTEGPLGLSGAGPLSCRGQSALRLAEGLLRQTEGPLMPREVRSLGWHRAPLDQQGPFQADRGPLQTDRGPSDDDRGLFRPTGGPLLPTEGPSDRLRYVPRTDGGPLKTTVCLLRRTDDPLGLSRPLMMISEGPQTGRGPCPADRGPLQADRAPSQTVRGPTMPIEGPSDHLRYLRPTQALSRRLRAHPGQHRALLDCQCPSHADVRGPSDWQRALSCQAKSSLGLHRAPSDQEGPSQTVRGPLMPTEGPSDHLRYLGPTEAFSRRLRAHSGQQRAPLGRQRAPSGRQRAPSGRQRAYSVHANRGPLQFMPTEDPFQANWGPQADRGFPRTNRRRLMPSEGHFQGDGGPTHSDKSPSDPKEGPPGRIEGLLGSTESRSLSTLLLALR